MPLKNLKILTHEPPGTLKYTGKQRPRTVTLEVIEYDSENVTRRRIKNLSELPKANNKIVWLNVVGMHDTKLIEEIGTRFDIHRIDLEGVVNVNERSKIERKDEYLFAILKMVYLAKNWVVHEHIAVIMKGNLLITFQEHKVDVFDAVRERIETGAGQVRKMGADYLFNSLIDNIIDQYYTILNFVSERFSQTEESIIIGNNNEMQKVYWLRKELLFLKINLEPVEATLKSITDKNHIHITDATLPYMNDVLDNVRQILDEIVTYREMVANLYETQMSNSSNDMNKIMMTLTIFSAIFIPLSFLAGVFGMNFLSVPGVAGKASFAIFCGACVLIAAGMLVFFKARKWF